MPKKIGLIIIPVAFIGILLRIYNIGVPSLNADEAFGIYMANLSFRDFFETIRIDSHPPLFYLLVRFWTLFGRTELILRALSVIPGVFTIYIIYFWGKKYIDEKTGIVAAFLTSISSWLIMRDQEARMYSLSSLTIWISLHCFLEATSQGKKKSWFLYALFSLLSIYIHYNSFLILAVPWAYFFLKRQYLQNYKKLILSQAIIIIGYLPWIPVLYTQFSQKIGTSVLLVNSLYAKPFLTYLSEFFLYLDGGANISFNLFQQTIIILTFIVISCAGYTFIKDENQKCFIMLCILIPIAECTLIYFIFHRNVFSAKHMFYLFFPYYILLASGISSFYRINKLSPFLILSVFLFLNLNSWNHYIKSSLCQNPPWRDVVKVVESNSSEDEAIITYLTLGSIPFKYYAQKNMPMYMITPDNCEATIKFISEKYKKVWLILWSNELEDPKGKITGFFDENFVCIRRVTYFNAAPFDIIKIRLYDLSAKEKKK